jgi:glycosyltransferase involved in cell wall biosynthesis
MKIGIVSGDYLRADRSPDNKERWGGAGWARLGQYVEALRSAGHEVNVGHLWLRGNSLTVQDSDEVVHYPDVLLMQRLMHGGLDKSINIGRANGQIVVNDIDDWYWGLDPRNAAFKASHPKFNKKENTIFYKQVIGASDYVTVSTPYLADRVKSFAGGPIVVMKNYVDVARFTRRAVVDTLTPEVGWAGSTDHRSGDLEILRGVVNQLVTNKDIAMVHGGHLPTSPSFASQVGVPEDSVRCIQRTDHDGYPTLLDFDIGLVPLRDTPFNHAKSDIKGLEYAASGIPFIAAGLTSYAQLAKDWEGRGMYIAKRPSDWSRLIKLLSNYETRRDSAEAAYARVKSRDIRYGITGFLEFLSSL